MSKIFILLSIIVFGMSSCSDSKKHNTTTGGSSSELDEETVASADFSHLDVSGAVKVVVFIRDTSRVEIDDKTAMLDDPRCSVSGGVLHIAPTDTLPQNRIHSVRIYTPALVSYSVHDCGEANISGDDVKEAYFKLDVNNVNIFRGNACICADKAEINMDKMLMAKFLFATKDLSFTAKHYQHIELAGKAKQRHISIDAPHQIDTSQLKK